MTTGADIQLENGNWGRIHNAIWKALAKAPLTGEQFRCLMFLLGQTYGCRKKEDRISLAQFSEATCIRRQHVWRALHQLIDHHVIYMVANGPKRASTWGFNKYIEQWTFPSVTANGDSSVTTDGYRQVPSITTPGYSSDPIYNHAGLQSVTTPHENTKERKKEAAAAAETEKQNQTPPPPPALDPLFATFVQDYQHHWGLMVSSEASVAEIHEWTARVTPDGWRYALKEAADHNARNWKYLRSILCRVEQEGYAATLVPSSAAATFSLEDLV